MKKRLLFIFALLSVIICFGSVKAYASDTEEEQNHYRGVANGTVNVRLGPGTKYDKVMLEDKTNLQLKAQEEVTIIGEAVADDGVVWYNLVVKRDDKEYEGYSSSNYVSKHELIPSPTPTPTPSPTPTPTLSPTKEEEAPNREPLISDNNDVAPNDKGGLLKVILVVIIVGVVALIGFMVFKLLGNRSASGNPTSRKIDLLKKAGMNNQSGNGSRKVPQIKKSDHDRSVREDVRSDIYYKNTVNDEYSEGVNASMQMDSDERRALRDAIDRLQEHDIVYHTIYGEGEVYDNSDVKLIEVRFGNDMRFLKKDQLVAKRELKIIDEEDQSIARRRRRRNTRR